MTNRLRTKAKAEPLEHLMKAQLLGRRRIRKNKGKRRRARSLANAWVDLARVVRICCVVVV